MARQGVSTGADPHSPQPEGYFVSLPSGKSGTGDPLANPHHIPMQTRLLITQQQ